MLNYGDYSVNKQVFTKHGLGRIESINDSPTGLVTFVVNVKGITYSLAYNQINIEDIFSMNIATNEEIPLDIQQILKFKSKENDLKSNAHYSASYIRELCNAVLINVDEDVINTISYMKRIAETIKNVKESCFFKKTYTPINVESAIHNVFRFHINSNNSYNYTITSTKKLLLCLDEIDDNDTIMLDLDVYEFIYKWAIGKSSLTEWYCETLRLLSYDMYSSRKLDEDQYYEIMEEIR